MQDNSLHALMGDILTKKHNCNKNAHLHADSVFQSRLNSEFQKGKSEKDFWGQIFNLQILI